MRVTSLNHSIPVFMMWPYATSRLTFTLKRHSWSHLHSKIYRTTPKMQTSAFNQDTSRRCSWFLRFYFLLFQNSYLQLPPRRYTLNSPFPTCLAYRCPQRRRQWPPVVGGTSPPSRRCFRLVSPSTIPVVTPTLTCYTWLPTVDR